MGQSRARNQFLTAAVVIIVIAIGLLLFIRRAGEGTGNATSTISVASSTETTSTKNISGITGTGDFTVELISDTSRPPAPDFRAPITFSSEISSEVRTKLTENASILIGRISKNPVDLRSWIDLGTTHKMGGDYKRAETYWQYVTKLAPHNSIAFHNLGDLYQNFLKDYPKAEANWLAAIRIDPSDTNPYRSLYDLYSDLYKKGTGAAETILKKGVTANPLSVDLHVILARYYKSAGKSAEAKAEYQAAIKSAESQGQTDLADQIRAEE